MAQAILSAKSCSNHARAILQADTVRTIVQVGHGIAAIPVESLDGTMPVRCHSRLHLHHLVVRKMAETVADLAMIVDHEIRAYLAMDLQETASRDILNANHVVQETCKARLEGHLVQIGNVAMRHVDLAEMDHPTTDAEEAGCLAPIKT